MKTISIPFRFASDTGGVSSSTSLRSAIEQQIIDILSTTPGERVMNPRYGAGLKSLLFEMMDPLVFAEYRLDAISELNEYMTLAKIQDLVITTPDTSFYASPEETTIRVSVKYSIPPHDSAVVTFSLTNTETTPLGGA